MKQGREYGESTLQSCRKQTDGGGEETSQKVCELPTLGRGMFVQGRQFDLAPGDIVKDN